MLIRLVLITAALALLLFLLRRRDRARTRAWIRILLVLLVVAYVVAVLQPDLVSAVAGWLGVGRGTDLLLYAVTVAFVYVVIAVYLKFRDLQQDIADLARRLAISEASAAERAGQQVDTSVPDDGANPK